MVAKRYAFDLYQTPGKLVKPLMNYLGLFETEYVLPYPTYTALECCSDGDHNTGSIAKVLSQHGMTVYTNDIRPGLNTDYNFDATILKNWQQTLPEITFNYVISNPPFNVADQILPLAYRFTKRYMFMLLRLSYLEPCENRQDWLDYYKDQQILLMPVNPRPRFRHNNGGDNVTVAWFGWDKRHSWEKLGVKFPFEYCYNWHKL